MRKLLRVKPGKEDIGAILEEKRRSSRLISVTRIRIIRPEKKMEDNKEAVMNGLEKLKQLLGLGAAVSDESVVEEVESQVKTLKEIREALDCPRHPAAEVKERLKASRWNMKN